MCLEAVFLEYQVLPFVNDSDALSFEILSCFRVLLGVEKVNECVLTCVHRDG